MTFIWSSTSCNVIERLSSTSINEVGLFSFFSLFPDKGWNISKSSKLFSTTNALNVSSFSVILSISTTSFLYFGPNRSTKCWLSQAVCLPYPIPSFFCRQWASWMKKSANPPVFLSSMSAGRIVGLMRAIWEMFSSSEIVPQFKMIHGGSKSVQLLVVSQLRSTTKPEFEKTIVFIVIFFRKF